MDIMLFAVLLTILTLHSVSSQRHQDQRAFVSISNTDKLSVNLECLPQEMHVFLRWNEGPFRNWIVLGAVGDRTECRFKGNGSALYELRVQLKGDACGTQMDDLGRFYNIIRISAHPTLILDSDERVAVQCLYGPPVVEPYELPRLPPAQAIVPSRPIPPAVLGNDENIPASDLSSSTIVLITLLVLFFTLAALLCACCFFFFKRRKDKVERRNKMLLTVPANSEIGKMGLWWPTGSAKSNNGDALLSHDYMISAAGTHSTTRDPLSVNTSDQSADHTSSSDTSPRDARQLARQAAGGAASYENQTFVHDMRRPGGHPRALHAIPEERLSAGSGTPKYNERAIDVGPQRNLGSSEQILTAHSITASNSRIATNDVRSVTEVYSANGVSPPADDNVSIRTLDGSGGITIESTPTRTARAEIHRGSLQAFPVNDYVRAIEEFQARSGVPGTRLSPVDIGKWRSMLSNDANLQQSIRAARNLDDFQNIGRSRPNDFTRDQWALIAQALSKAAVVGKLNDLIDGGSSRPQSSTFVAPPRRFAKKADVPTVPTVATVGGTAAILRSSPGRREFTRDSYIKVKDSMSPEAQRPRRIVQAPVTIGAAGVRTFRERSSSETIEPAQTLQVIMGDLDHRPLHESAHPDTLPSHDSLYPAAVQNVHYGTVGGIPPTSDV